MIQKIIYLVGPTASGKTNIANNLATFFNIPILSMDSMQIYKELDIGTSKPSNEDLSKIIYFGIDIVNPDHLYSAADYINYANEIVENHDYKAILIVGGTGLYYDGLTIGFSKIPPKNLSIREKLIEYYKENGIESIYKLLTEVDSNYAEKIKKNDLKRIIRALEVYQITGKPFSFFHMEKDIKPILKENLKFGIIMRRKNLYERIDKRVDLMFESGFLKEAEILYKKFKDKDLPSLKALGYSDIFNFISNKISFNEAKENIKRKTRNYAKRQITWFKRDSEIKWLFLMNPDELNIAKNFQSDNLQLINKKRRKNRLLFEDFETELAEFISSFNNFEFILEENLFDYLKQELEKFIN